MPRVVHFEILADQPDRAIKFYNDVFGWNIRKWDGPAEYWLISTGEEGAPGIDGGMIRRPTPQHTHTINTIDVESVDEYLKKIGEGGGTVVEPKHPIPGVGYLAYCQDPEGNLFGIMESDHEAA